MFTYVYRTELNISILFLKACETSKSGVLLSKQVSAQLANISDKTRKGLQTFMIAHFPNYIVFYFISSIQLNFSTNSLRLKPRSHCPGFQSRRRYGVDNEAHRNHTVATPASTALNRDTSC